MKADISISGVFSCKGTGEPARWTLRDVDLLEPGMDTYEFQAIADRR
ncbi:MAG: hypothetical protein ACXV5I_02915 [Halobacteriota archaeon]